LLLAGESHNVAEVRLVDYYSVLNLPHDADLTGVENAYARISDELAGLTEVDDECRQALDRVNEAYAVLSKPELRRGYDAIFLAKEREAERRRWDSLVYRRVWAQRAIITALGLIVVAQAVALAYIGWDELSDAFGSIAVIF
jgi:curved DNA-binding protein CbpA